MRESCHDPGTDASAQRAKARSKEPKPIAIPAAMSAKGDIRVGLFFLAHEAGTEQNGVLIAQGRDAADVPLTHSFGEHRLVDFRVWIDRIESERQVW